MRNKTKMVVAISSTKIEMTAGSMKAQTINEIDLSKKGGLVS